VNSTHTSRPTFIWTDPNPTGVTGYTVQISKTYANNVFGAVLNTGSPTGRSYTPAVNLPVNSVLYWRVQAKGANGPSSWSPVWAFVTGNPPSIPVLGLPVNNSLYTGLTAGPTLVWKSSTLPLSLPAMAFAHYRVQLATDAAFNNLVVDDTGITSIGTAQFTLASPLNSNSTYYWRVGAYNTLGDYIWSLPFTLRTVLAAPTLSAPTNAATAVGARPTFTWTDPNNAKATGYTIQISKNSTFTLLVSMLTVTSPTYTPTVNLPVGTLYWRVKANGPNGPSVWSGTFSFTTP
jgi:hypothetical protein